MVVYGLEQRQQRREIHAARRIAVKHLVEPVFFAGETGTLGGQFNEVLGGVHTEESAAGRTGAGALRGVEVDKGLNLSAEGTLQYFDAAAIFLSLHSCLAHSYCADPADSLLPSLWSFPASPSPPLVRPTSEPY